MMIRHQLIFSFIAKLGKDASATKTLYIADLYDPGLYASSKVNILLMIQATDELVRNDQKPNSFRASYFCVQVSAVFDEIHFHHLVEDKEKFLTSAVLLTQRFGERE